MKFVDIDWNRLLSKLLFTDAKLKFLDDFF